MLPIVRIVKQFACIKVNGSKEDSSHCSTMGTWMNLYQAKSPLRVKASEGEQVWEEGGQATSEETYENTRRRWWMWCSPRGILYIFLLSRELLCFVVVVDEWGKHSYNQERLFTSWSFQFLWAKCLHWCSSAVTGVAWMCSSWRLSQNFLLHEMEGESCSHSCHDMECRFYLLS